MSSRQEVGAGSPGPAPAARLHRRAHSQRMLAHLSRASARHLHDSPATIRPGPRRLERRAELRRRTACLTPSNPPEAALRRRQKAAVCGVPIALFKQWYPQSIKATTDQGAGRVAARRLWQRSPPSSARLHHACSRRRAALQMTTAGHYRALFITLELVTQGAKFV
jgi:hypothetical protein